MGRKGPRLVPFLKSGMIDRKYKNLIPEDPSGLIFSIVLPHKTRKLDAENELLFKEWYALNGKKYVFNSKHYTDAKQAITASLRKSDYVDKIHISNHKLTYRILSKAEVKEKKRLKKEQKKLSEVKKEACDSDDALSAVESGYGSSSDSPENEFAQISLNDNLITASGNESEYSREADSPLADYAQVPRNDNLVASSGFEPSLMFDTLETDDLFGFNDVLQTTCSDNFYGFPKLEPMDAVISAENSLAVPDTSIFYESDVFTNIQPFVDESKSVDYFPINTEYPTHSLDLMDCSKAPELWSSDSVDLLQLDSMSVEELSNMFKDIACNTNTPLVHEGIIKKQVSETQNGYEMPSEPGGIFSEDICSNLIEDISSSDFHAPVNIEEKNLYQISSSPDTGFPCHKTEEMENVYLCKKCLHLGKTPILFCEPLLKNSSEILGELKIAFDEAVLKEINGFKSVKECKFIDDHLMVILEPNDD